MHLCPLGKEASYLILLKVNMSYLNGLFKCVSTAHEYWVINTVTWMYFPASVKHFHCECCINKPALPFLQITVEPREHEMVPDDKWAWRKKAHHYLIKTCLLRFPVWLLETKWIRARSLCARNVWCFSTNTVLKIIMVTLLKPCC